MQRRSAGLIMVIITVIGVLVINAMTGRSVPGFAAAQPPPVAPGSGSCLLDGSTGWDEIDCAEPHTAEIVESWSASAASPSSLYEPCMSASQTYLGDQWGQSGGSPTQAGWSVPPVMSNTVLVSGPGPDLVPGWSWQACIVRPILLGSATSGYRGRLRDVPATGVLPVALRPCFDRPGGLTVVGVPCSAQHTGEVLAARELQVFGGTTALDTTATDPQVQDQCLAIARRTTDATDPTYSGKLQVVVNLHATGMGFVTSPARNSAGSISKSYVMYQASCALQTVGSGAQLSASIIGLGNGPLPIHS